MITTLAVAAMAGSMVLPVESAGRTRRVQVITPEVSTGAALILLHGAGGDHTFMDRTALSADARGAGVTLAVPDGTGFFRQGWRAAEGCCGEALLWQSDDVAFLDALAAQLRSELGVTTVAVVGFSNGGMLAQRWGCESDAVDLVVSMAGPLLVPTCDGPPKPVLLAHGLGDANVPPAGGVGASGTTYPSTEDGLAAWRARNRCGAATTRAVGPRVSHTEWACAAPTHLFEVRRWGHRWPGGTAAGRLGWDLTAEVLRRLAEQHDGSPR